MKPSGPTGPRSPQPAAPKTQAPSTSASTGAPQPAAPETSRGYGLNDGFQSKRVNPNHWWPGRPLSEARHAHKTNTAEQFQEAMKGGYNFFEADIRAGINPPHELECRHDETGEPGNNLTLKQWLKMGKDSGRGLKLDVKEYAYVPKILDEVQAADIPDGRLMINLGDSAMSKYGAEIRRRFPNAILAINPKRSEAAKLNETQVKRMLELADKLGGPVTFVVRYDQLTPAATEQLTAKGTVSVWNDPGIAAPENPPAVGAELRRMGVNGVIDLRPPESKLEKAENALKKLPFVAKDKLEGWF
ncbi:MAG: FAM151A/B family protein [Myxococcaceae bacterium]